jgi:hypothetical protein
MGYDPGDPAVRRKQHAWSVACSSSIQTREDPLLIYNRLMNQFETIDKEKHMSLNESNKSK